MKKFLCMFGLMLAILTAQAAVQMSAYSPPDETECYSQVAILSLDGQTVTSFDSQLNIVEWQNPFVLSMEAGEISAQVVNVYTAQDGIVSMTLVCYRWPNSETETMNLRNDYTGNYAPDGDAYSFTSSRADFS